MRIIYIIKTISNDGLNTPICWFDSIDTAKYVIKNNTGGVFNGSSNFALIEQIEEGLSENFIISWYKILYDIDNGYTGIEVNINEVPGIIKNSHKFSIG